MLGFVDYMDSIHHKWLWTYFNHPMLLCTGAYHLGFSIPL
jgi:hypothetical protein